MPRMVKCIKLGKELEGLQYPPVPGELGKKIWRQVSKEAWQNWQQLQTMMVNEYQLNLSDPEVRKHLLNSRMNLRGQAEDITAGLVLVNMKRVKRHVKPFGIHKKTVEELLPVFA